MLLKLTSDFFQAMKTHFTDEDLYDIFSCDDETVCNTHDLMECDCGGCGLLDFERGDIVENEASSLVCFI